MLESMTLQSGPQSDKASSQFARLHLHEFEDHSDSEDVLHSYEKNHVYKKKHRSSSTGARSNFVRDMEARLAGLRHEKLKSQISGASRDEKLSGLIYDADFDCYYNPLDDQYYKLQPSNGNSQ
uniref:AGC-kinase C-terminal domain-containing protein n=1 Tax=Haemonchus contortus TaxID=6289 RepID=A0A7I4YKX4_HAECO